MLETVARYRLLYVSIKSVAISKKKNGSNNRDNRDYAYSTANPLKSISEVKSFAILI